jgi:hypothetical protein
VIDVELEEASTEDEALLLVPYTKVRVVQVLGGVWPGELLRPGAGVGERGGGEFPTERRVTYHRIKYLLDFF